MNGMRVRACVCEATLLAEQPLQNDLKGQDDGQHDPVPTEGEHVVPDPDPTGAGLQVGHGLLQVVDGLDDLLLRLDERRQDARQPLVHVALLDVCLRLFLHRHI